jgi:hypothetical protein
VPVIAARGGMSRRIEVQGTLARQKFKILSNELVE